MFLAVTKPTHPASTWTAPSLLLRVGYWALNPHRLQFEALEFSVVRGPAAFVRNAESHPSPSPKAHPDLLNQTLRFNKTLTWCVYTVEFEKRWPKTRGMDLAGRMSSAGGLVKEECKCHILSASALGWLVSPKTLCPPRTCECHLSSIWK